MLYIFLVFEKAKIFNPHSYKQYYSFTNPLIVERRPPSIPFWDTGIPKRDTEMAENAGDNFLLTKFWYLKNGKFPKKFGLFGKKIWWWKKFCSKWGFWLRRMSCCPKMTTRTTRHSLWMKLWIKRRRPSRNPKRIPNLFFWFGDVKLAKK